MNVLDLCPYWTTPPRGGGQLRVHNLNKRVARVHPVEQWSFRPTLNDEGRWWGRPARHPAPGYVERQLFAPFALAAAGWADRLRTNPDAYMSAVLRWTGPPSLRRAAARADVVQVEHPWLFDHARRVAPGKPVVLAAHNVESALLRQRDPPPSPARLRRVEEMEARAVREADAVVALSADDAAALSRLGPRAPVLVAPNGVDTEAFRPVDPETRAARKKELGLPEGPLAVFAGGVHHPNVEAARALRALAPAFRRHGVEVLVLGRAAAPADAAPGFRPLGFVEDVLPYYEAADFAVNPLASGSGSSLKALEFLAMGLPTVSTDVGARGFDVRDGRELLLRPRESFPDAIGELLADPARARLLAERGRAFVERACSWEASARVLLSAYAALAS